MEEVGWPDKRRQVSFFEEHPACVGVVAEVGGEAGGEVVGAAFGTKNGDVGWLGLIFVRRSFQRRGVGADLTRAASASLEERGCSTLLLTATQAGRPLYEKLGFVRETDYHGFVGAGSAAAPENVSGFRPVGEQDFPEVCALDRRVTGEDRAAILKCAGPGWILRDNGGEVLAYHAGVPWREGPVGGPAVALGFDSGARLVEHRRVVAGAEGSVVLWLAAENRRGREHLEKLGFEERKVVARMRRGEPASFKPECLWGVFSLAKG